MKIDLFMWGWTWCALVGLAIRMVFDDFSWLNLCVFVINGMLTAHFNKAAKRLVAVAVDQKGNRIILP